MLQNCPGTGTSAHAYPGLTADGWVAISTSARTASQVAKAVRSIAESLGEIALGRFRQSVEQVVPEDFEDARPSSLSSKFGLNPLPLHTDTAHWAIPVRYLVLGCANPGLIVTPTSLLDRRHVIMSDAEAKECISSVFLIRNGRRSFYGSIMEFERPFIRLDLGCMIPLSQDAKLAMQIFGSARNSTFLSHHYWDVGDVIIIDNWRMLHGRGTDQFTQRGRILLRAMVR